MKALTDWTRQLNRDGQATAPKFRLYPCIALGALVAATAAVPIRALSAPGNSQAGGLPALEQRVSRLETLVAQLQSTNAAQAQQIAALQAESTQQAARIASLENTLAHFSRQGNDIYITGANLHIVNGLGTTNGAADPSSLNPAAIRVNGLGNLIVGYNAASPFTPNRQGSHNLVLGDFNQYSSFGAVVAGRENTAAAPYGSVFGGRTNRTTAPFGGVVGGAFNICDGNTGAIVGGNDNRASNIDAVVCGGSGNRATARFATVGGGAGVVQGTEFGWSAGSFGPGILGQFRSP